MLLGNSSSGGGDGTNDETSTTTVPGLAPLLLCACRERGLGAAASTSNSNGSSSSDGNEYSEVKQACYAPLLALASAEAGKDVAMWRSASGELEALCISHRHLEGLFELAVQVLDTLGRNKHLYKPQIKAH
jgi:hypothetical protein